MFLYYCWGYMQAYVWLLEAEPGEHSVVIINFWIGISGHLEIVGAFRGAGGSCAYGRSELLQIFLRLFWTSDYVFVYCRTFAFCHVAFSAFCGGFFILARMGHAAGN